VIVPREGDVEVRLELSDRGGQRDLDGRDFQARLGVAMAQLGDGALQRRAKKRPPEKILKGREAAERCFGDHARILWMPLKWAKFSGARRG
jgi:hypothetical protein